MISILLALAMTGTALQSEPAHEQCGVCHPSERVAFENSIHAREQVGCTACHGGVAASIDTDRAHQGDFHSLADRGSIPALCARCHSDSSLMRPYNLPTDQYVLYQTSEHGKANARGEYRAAICSDCHGAHDILPPTDPASRMHPRNIPTTCASCHSDAVLMAEFGLDAAAVEDYRNSIHGKALLEGGNSGAPDCNRCHGVHGAAPYGVGDVEKVCGACHQQVRRAFREGPHYQGMLASGLQECASCHGMHAIRTFEDRAVGEICSECHAEESAEVLLGRKLYSLILAAQTEIEKAEALVREVEQIPLDIEDRRARIIQARTYLKELPTVTHGLSAENLETLARRARSVGEEVQHDIYAELGHRSARQVGLVALWFYILMTVAILVGYKRRLSKGEAA